MTRRTVTETATLTGTIDRGQRTFYAGGQALTSSSTGSTGSGTGSTGSGTGSIELELRIDGVRHRVERVRVGVHPVRRASPPTAARTAGSDATPVERDERVVPANVHRPRPPSRPPPRPPRRRPPPARRRSCRPRRPPRHHHDDGADDAEPLDGAVERLDLQLAVLADADADDRPRRRPPGRSGSGRSRLVVAGSPRRALPPRVPGPTSQRRHRSSGAATGAPGSNGHTSTLTSRVQPGTERHPGPGAVDDRRAIRRSSSTATARSTARCRPASPTAPTSRSSRRRSRSLGYDDGGAMTVDDHFDCATKAAVEAWQTSLGGHRQRHGEHLRRGVLTRCRARDRRAGRRR